ncbi:kinesin-like protein KIF19 isoform X1 [Maylandia zebra]|uniref:kinesin-like protein KIF19 isoform X1 n=1 Tax=Maylandia zebra TaxID=106582 RepID=UPI000329E7C0|nr:kinesin-like protein KIF19 isoform X1 [Maylandia zebra]XP_014264067.1 kinesin-like protein KIF19 isoform X1 [Maylandia zebra]
MKDTGESKDHQLTVALRIRPLSDAEQEEGATIVAHRVDDQMVVLMDPMEDPDDILRANRSREKTYMFDVAFDFSASQEEVYRATTKGLIEGLISGYNATVFAYGPTGCGKTYTMLGTDKEPGIYVRTLNDLFRAIEETSDDMLYSVSMSYLEIYNEMIRDLLNPSSGFLDLREDSKGVIQVAGITEVSTINAQEIMELLMKGNKQRTQEPTAANQTSSRSHAVLQVAVKQQSRCRDVLQEVRFARLFMIDLAGSERAAQTQNRGQRLKEGAHINRSLLALGNCINALSDKNGNKYVNYRDSKLTRLLKDSLGGNSRTVMIAHISPASVAFEESRNTLTYADRAKSIRTRVKKNMINVSYHIAQYTNIISDLRCEIERLKKKIAEQASRQLNSDRADIRNVQAEVQAHSSQQSREEMDLLREQLLDAFRQQMQIRKSLMELENNNMEIQIATSNNLLTITDWEQERSRRRRKWRAERRKESVNKDESEKDSDSSESPPDTTETQEVAIARENLVALMAEQKKIHKEKALLERRFLELRDQARRLEELLPRRVSSEEQREVLGLLCKVHELEIENAEMQSHALLKDNVIRQKNFVVQRFEQHRHLCDEIIQQQRQFIDDHSLPVPPHLQELYDMYMKELDDRKLEKAIGLEKVTIRQTIKEVSLPKIALPSRGRDNMQDIDSDQESIRNMCSDNRRGQAKIRRHTLPPILPEPDLDNNRVFKSSPHARQMKNSAVMTPPPIHINGKGNRELQPLAPESFLSYSHLSHSVSSHLDSSPESSEAGADIPLSINERQQILKGVQNIAVKAARRRSKALEVDVLRLPSAPSPLDPKKQKSSLSLSEAPPRGLPMRRVRQPSPELRHATSDDNLSSSTGEGPGLHVTWTRPRNRQVLNKNQTPREADLEGRRKKRRSRSFEVTGQAVPQTKTSTAQRFRPLDSTSDPHLHINVQPQAPMLRPQYRGVPPLAKVRPPHSSQQTGSNAESSTTNMNNLKRAPQLRQPQPLLYITNTGAGAQRIRRH